MKSAELAFMKFLGFTDIYMYVHIVCICASCMSKLSLKWKIMKIVYSDICDIHEKYVCCYLILV